MSKVEKSKHTSYIFNFATLQVTLFFDKSTFILAKVQ